MRLLTLAISLRLLPRAKSLFERREMRDATVLVAGWPWTNVESMKASLSKAGPLGTRFVSP